MSMHVLFDVNYLKRKEGKSFGVVVTMYVTYMLLQFSAPIIQNTFPDPWMKLTLIKCPQCAYFGNSSWYHVGHTVRPIGCERVFANSLGSSPHLPVWHQGIRPEEAMSDCLFVVRVAESCSSVACWGLGAVWVERNWQGEDGQAADINGWTHKWMEGGTGWMNECIHAGWTTGIPPGQELDRSVFA